MVFEIARKMIMLKPVALLLLSFVLSACATNNRQVVPLENSPEVLVGVWRGYWRSSEQPHSGPFNFEVISIAEDEVSGTVAFGGKSDCPQRFDVHGRINVTKLEMGGELPNPCKAYTGTFEIIETSSDKYMLKGDYRVTLPADRGIIRLTKD